MPRNKKTSELLDTKCFLLFSVNGLHRTVLLGNIEMDTDTFEYTEPG